MYTLISIAGRMFSLKISIQICSFYIVFGKFFFFCFFGDFVGFFYSTQLR